MSAPAPFPPSPRGHWLLGHLPERRREPLNFFMRMFREHGDLVRLRMGPVHLSVFMHPNHAKRVLLDEVGRYGKGWVYEELHPLAGNGLFTSDRELWKQQRRLIQPAFHRERLTRLGAVMVDVIEEWLRTWEQGGHGQQIVPVVDEMTKVTLRVVCSTLMGTDMPPAVIQQVCDSFLVAKEIANDRILSPLGGMLGMNRLPTGRNRAFNTAVNSMNKIVFDIIARRHGATEGQHEDLLSMLMAARDADTGIGMSDQQLRDEVMTLVLAGHETTATALSWVFHALDLYPDVAAQVEAEVDSVLSGRRPTVEDLPKLRYTSNVLEETMRLWPPLWMMPRMLHEEDVVDGFRIPKKDIVLLVPYVIHRRPDFWPDPERFDPSRFQPEQVKQRPRQAYLAFGGGQRLCVGQHFAMMESLFIIAMVVQRYRLKSLPAHPVEPDASISLRPKGAMPMQLEKRFRT